MSAADTWNPMETAPAAMAWRCGFPDFLQKALRDIEAKEPISFHELHQVTVMLAGVEHCLYSESALRDLAREPVDGTPEQADDFRFAVLEIGSRMFVQGMGLPGYKMPTGELLRLKACLENRVRLAGKMARRWTGPTTQG